MEEAQQKFSNSKEVIAYLADKFPNCFSLKGDAKPLKIGIFQELATRLEEDERVSKTLLRSTLRHYTNSWRYLHSIKEGAYRVDLDGNQDAQIEKEHADHARQQLDESKEKAALKRKAQNDSASHKQNTRQREKASTTSSPARRNVEGKKGTKSKSSRPTKTPPPKLTENDLHAGTQVTVKLGKAPMHAVITEVAKDGIHVQLDSGMVVKVTSEALRLASSKRS
ncbi:RNA chaperone ProQ [Alteromonas ponticola]|uniref:RNA chaperone ProQ n=1 Tax=Alteromonas ponticola TaxID=2720613 RepID=A0ABX1QZR7_9ALTE|nr:RNA chaperone ProQ [Alteromonas ponticola]NMH58435.1 RNA chaperone ProQ [Alteromonas ponticola]